MKQFPIFIICRDRLTPLQELLRWLKDAGEKNIYLIDNQSTYPPMVEFLETTKYIVIRSEHNTQESPWIYMQDSMHDYFVVTDPDVIPGEMCPRQVIYHMYTRLSIDPSIVKLGLSLKIDDLPDHYVHKEDVMAWESQFWQHYNARHDYYLAPIDTTFALYKPNTPYVLSPAARMAPPYEARHLPWYMHSKYLTNEEKYYREHMNGAISNWNRENLPDALRKRS